MEVTSRHLGIQLSNKPSKLLQLIEYLNKQSVDYDIVEIEGVDYLLKNPFDIDGIISDLSGEYFHMGNKYNAKEIINRSRIASNTCIAGPTFVYNKLDRGGLIRFSYEHYNRHQDIPLGNIKESFELILSKREPILGFYEIVTIQHTRGSYITAYTEDVLKNSVEKESICFLQDFIDFIDVILEFDLINPGTVGLEIDLYLRRLHNFKIILTNECSRRQEN